MKHTFLEYVANDLLKKFGTDFSHVAVVFPNKRASLFLDEYLARESDQPIWSPTYITISDLFRAKSNLCVADPIKQVCELYKSFTQQTQTDETLDHFYGWGQLLLADFDDVDKNMADAAKVFANLKDLHALDSVDYLSDEQREALREFFGNFSDGHNSELKQRFLNLWCHLENIYHDFNRRLTQQGLAYEGSLYRQVVGDDSIQFEYEAYIFVGFNMLQQVEQALFHKLKALGKAFFYWDFDKYYIEGNEAGHYIAQYLASFPNEIDITDAEVYDNLRKAKNITYISATTENAQARYVTEWLRQGERIAAGRRTAIVLCDESLLQSVIHSLPPEADKVNITTGYPLAMSPVVAFVEALFALQTAGRKPHTDKYRLHYVRSVLRHPYMRHISSGYAALLADLDEHKRYYPSIAQLAKDEGLAAVFAYTDDESSSSNLSLTRWALHLLQIVGRNAKDEADPLFQESVFRMYTLLTRLSTLIECGDLDVDKITYERLMRQLVDSTTIPFHGEPAEGIQIMGLLETRNLDFDHVLVLSTNEGNMPKGVNDASFIPYSIRKAYGLTTVDNKVAIYAYYFHSLIQRGSDITLAYNNAVEDGHPREMSRFMLQLLVESPHSIQRLSLQPMQTIPQQLPTTIEKTEAVMDALYAIESLSPTAINRYIECPLKFYYYSVADLKEADDDDEDEIDKRVFGNIFHKSAQLVYQWMTRKGATLTDDDFKAALARPDVINGAVDTAFKEELFHLKDASYAPEYNGLQLISRGVIIDYLKQLLQVDRQLSPLTILALERSVYATIEFETPRGSHAISIGGIIDRLDETSQLPQGSRIRVIDYKTGNKITQATNSIDELFSAENLSAKHTNYYLQTLLYSLIVSHDTQLNPRQLPVSPGLVFIQHMQGADYDPTLAIDKKKIDRATDYEHEFGEGLRQTLQSIFDNATPFTATADKTRCDYCPYAQLCKK